MTLAGRRIALVEDDEIMGASIHQRLGLEGAEVIWLKQAVRALHAIRTPRRPIDAVVCDIRLPDGSGEELFLTLCRTSAPPPFLFITGQGEVAQAVRLLKAGAVDYVTKPFEIRGLLERLDTLVAPAEGDPSLLGPSPAARDVERRLLEAAEHDGPVVLSGQSGTGKVRLARHLHGLSRHRGPLVEWSSGSGPETDPFAPGGPADRAREGTLLLAGLDALSSKAQAALVRRLDDRPAFRLVATGPEDLGPDSGGGAVGVDLWGRLAAGLIRVPPLAGRPEDALWLARQIFCGANARRCSPLRGLSAPAEGAILDHPWLGNGREVRTRVVRGVAAARGDWLFPVDLFPEQETGEAPLQPLSQVRDAAERAHIAAALDRAQGHASEAARLLGVSRTTLWEKMQKLGL